MPKTHTLILKPWEAAAFADGSKTSLLRLVPDKVVNMDWTVPSAWEPYPPKIFYAMQSPYQRGDTLMCKETWIKGHAELPDGTLDWDNEKIWYRADGDLENWLDGSSDWGRPVPWRSPVTMPRWAVRTVRKVVGVQCLRVQDITEEQALADSVKTMYQVWEQNHTGPLTVAFNPRVIWSYQLEQDYPGAWERNDWAWLYDLEVV